MTLPSNDAPSSASKDSASEAKQQEGGGKSVVAVKEKPKKGNDDGPDGPTGGKGKPKGGMGGYSISPTTYTNKKGKTTDMSLLKFDNELTPEQERTVKEFAKERTGEGRFAPARGWKDRESGGWMFRSEEDARKAAEMVGSDEAVAERKAAEAKQQDEQRHEAAVAQAEQDKVEKRRKEEEQKAVGTHTVNPKIKKKWDESNKIEGNANVIVLPDGSKLRGHYVLTEAGAATASHDASNGFEPTEGFPVDENGQSVNDRDYRRDKDAQRMVDEMANGFDSRALQSPVIVSQDGVVLSGNNRTMSGDIAAKQGTDKAYVDHLREFGQMYGFAPEQIDGMQHPRVVFVPDEPLPYDAATFARFNAETQKRQSKPEHAVKLGKIVPDNVFGSIATAIGGYDRLSGFYADSNAVNEVLKRLFDAGVINEMQLPELRTGNALSAAGKELIENLLVGKAFQDAPDAVRQLIAEPNVKQAVVMALSEIAHNRTLEKSGYSLGKELAAAIDLVYRARKSNPDMYKNGVPVSPFGRQLGLFDGQGDQAVTDGAVLLLADLLSSGKTSDLRKVLAAYNAEATESASGQADIFSGKVLSKEEILKTVTEHFKNATRGEQKKLVDAAVDKRKQAAAERGGRGKESEQTEHAAERGEKGGSREPTGGGRPDSQTYKVDNQGNPIDKEGKFITEKVSSVDELTDEDFTASTRSVQLPELPQKVADVLGTGGKPVIIKKNIFEKNKKRHGDLSPKQSRNILINALYSPHLYGNNQKASRPYNWILIHNAKKHSSVVLEVNHNKDNVEIINWHYLDDEALKQKERQAIKEGGRILTLESAAGDTHDDLSASKDSTSEADAQEGGGKSAVAVNEKPKGGKGGGGYSITPTTYTNKKGKTTDMSLLKFDNELTPEQERAVKEFAKERTGEGRFAPTRGWKDRESGGWMFRSEEDARKAAEMVGSDEAVAEHKPKGGKGGKADGGSKPSERKIDDVGEHIAGARKDALAKLSQSVADVTLESLIGLPASKAFKRPDLKKAVKEGALRETDARFAEAVMAAYLGTAKPKLKEGYKRASSEEEVRAWAEHAKEGVDMLARLFSLDEAGRDKFMAEVRSRKAYSEEEVRERQRQLEQWNPGRKFNGTCYPLNPVDVMARVMERLGHEPGAKVTLPVVAAAPDSGFGQYVLTTRNGKPYYPGRRLTTIDDVVDEIVYAAKVENADQDTDHPAGKFSVKGVGEPLKGSTGKWLVVTQRSLTAAVERHTLDSKEEAEAFAQKFLEGRGKYRYASKPTEEARTTGYSQYEIVYKHDNPTKGTYAYMPTGKVYGSLEEARAAIDGEHDELNSVVNAKLAEEKGKSGEGNKKDYLKIVSYTEDGRTWKYGVVLADKYAPKIGALDTMPFYLGDGFSTPKEAQAFVDEHREEWDAKVSEIDKARRDFVYFNGTGERTGKDWRKGADVSAGQLMEQFGFRGVQFGNWTNQRDRQAAVNGAFDALMDLAQILGVSPRALSLNGELGLAFGSRGGGSAAAHYELGEVVINLTKTQGAGALAHEWWHALDNYFARHGDVKNGMVTEVKGIAMRDELREAFNALIDSVAGSDYNKRSRARGASYWGRPTEETARLFAAWVNDELQKRGMSSPFLSDTDPGAAERYAEAMYMGYKMMLGDKAMTLEEFKKTPLALSGFVYPSTEELATFGRHLRNIFNTVQEKVDEQTGNTLLYHRGPVVAEPDEAEQALLGAVSDVLKDTGIEVVTDVDEGQRVLDAGNGNDAKLEARHRSDEAEKRNKMWRLIDRTTAMFTGKTEKEAREARRKEMQKITAERKEMYDRVLSGNFDEVTLRLINNYIANVTPRNREWRPLSKRLPQEVERGLRKGERASYVDALFSRICESAVSKNERAGAEGKRRIEEKKKELLKKWAIATGNWHTSVSDFTDAKEPLGSGKDSDVYISKDGKHVIKVSKGKDSPKKFRPDIDAVALFNHVFPNSRYEILGYGEVDGKFVKFLKQPFVDFTGSKPLSAEERVAYMSDMGFKPVNKEKTAFSNGTIVVADLQGNNIVRDKSGNIRVIDADVKLHTKDFGGQYSYPSVEADTALPQADSGKEVPRLQKVYHGSGADFDEFDHSHMGEGEGAQAYGWGTYVTEVEGLGRTYAQTGFLNAEARRKGNGDPKFLAVGKIINQETFNSDADTYEQRKSAAVEDLKRTIASFEKMLENQTDEKFLAVLRDTIASDKATLDALIPMTEEQFNEERSRQGRMRHLYTVDIPEDNGHNYLDYDGPVTESQKRLISEKLSEVDGYGPLLDQPDEYISGGDLYRRVSQRLGGDKAASKFFDSIGIVGMRYPAEYMSGGREDGAKDYVIFNERDARITDHVRFFRTPDGEAYGFTVGGKVYVDPRIARADTPIHEYTHLWSDMMRRVNPKAWADIVRLMKGKNSLWNWVKENYPELKTDDEIADEVLAQFSGKRGGERLREEMRKAADGEGSVTKKAAAVSALLRVKEALGKFWRGVAELLHIRFTTADEVADRVMADMLHGVDPRKVMDGGKSLRPDTRINVVEASPEHGFKNFADAKTWAKEHIARTYSSEETGGKGDIRVSNAAIGKYLSQAAVDKSDSKDVHLAVLKVLPDVLRESVDAEQHPDYNKGADGVRSAENGINPDVTIHRLYGAVTMGGKLYRVKVTLKEDSARSDDPKKAYSYEATKIELLAGQHGKDSETERFPRNSNNSITAANLLQGVEKSYGDGKFFEDDGMPRTGDPAADADEGKRFRLLDDDDPQAQELESLPESEPKETLAQAMVRRVKELAAKLGAKVRIVTSADELAKSPTGRQRKMKGMYDTETGEITIVVGNHENLADVENTMLHEAVGHGGFRVLFDTKEKLGHAMDELYRVSGEKIRKWIDGKMRKLYDAEVDRIMARKRKEREARGEKPSDFHLKDMADAHIEASSKKDEFRRIATEEYGANLAGRIGEKGFEKLSAEEQTFWGRLKSMLQKALQRLSEGLNITGKHEWTDKDWAYVLHEAYKRERNGGKPSIFDEADTIAMRMRTGFGETKFSDGKREQQTANERFNNELTRYQNGEMDKNEMLHLGRPQGVMRTFLPNLPIVMRQRVIKKGSEKKHEVDVSAIMNMPQHLSSPIFVFQRSEDTIGVLTDMRDRNGKNVCVAIELKRQIQQGAEYLEVNDVRSFHGREFKNIVEPIANNKALKWVDKEKGLAYLSSASQPVQQEIDKQVLDTATKVAKDFVNPKVSDENIADEGIMFRNGEGDDPDAGMMFRDGDDDDIGDVNLEPWRRCGQDARRRCGEQRQQPAHQARGDEGHRRQPEQTAPGHVAAEGV